MKRRAEQEEGSSWKNLLVSLRSQLSFLSFCFLLPFPPFRSGFQTRCKLSVVTASRQNRRQQFFFFFFVVVVNSYMSLSGSVYLPACLSISLRLSLSVVRLPSCPSLSVYLCPLSTGLSTCSVVSPSVFLRLSSLCVGSWEIVLSITS